MMNKTHVIEHLRFALEAQLTNAKQAAQAAHDDATHEESVAETQYDTLGLEAGYLAQGQAERVNDCYKDIKAFENVFNEPKKGQVSLGTLVCLLDESDTESWFYFGPSAGGLIVRVNNIKVQVVTPRAPLGKQLENKQVDDEVSLKVASKSLLFTIDKVL